MPPKVALTPKPLDPRTVAFATLVLAWGGAASLFAAQPEIVAEPEPAEISYRDSAVLAVEASGEALAFQWYQGMTGNVSLPVPGATGPLLVSQPLYSTASFWVRVSNPDGHDDSISVAVAVAPPVVGVMKGMGSGSSGQLGANGNPLIPKYVASDVIAVAAGNYHSLFIKPDKSVYGLGSNTFNQIGPGPSGSFETPQWIVSDVIHVSAGNYHDQFIRSDRSLWMMGGNSFGQLGDGTTTKRSAPVQLAADVVDVDGGEYHTIFLKRDGTLWGMGANNAGQLGDGTQVDRLTPVLVTGGVARVYSLYHQSLFIRTDGSLWGMGYNGFGQLGVASTANQSSPVKIAEQVIAAAGGNRHSLFLTMDGKLWGMGSNASGQLGLAGEEIRLSPVLLRAGVDRIEAGSSHSMFTTPDRVLRTTGYLHAGLPGFSDGIGYAAAVAGGGSHSLFVDASPVISDSPDSLVIASGTATTLGVTVDSNGPPAYQWFLGQPGDDSMPIPGATEREFTTPVLTDETSYWVRVTNAYGRSDSIGARVSIATPPVILTLSAGEPVAFSGNGVLSSTVGGGHLSYQWYTGTSGDISAPVPGATGPLLVTLPLRVTTSFWLRANNAAGSVDSPSRIIQVGAPVSGIVSTVGENEQGELGNGTSTDNSMPQEILHDITTVVGGMRRSFFLKSDGALWGAGDGDSGELGLGRFKTPNRPTPINDNVALVSSSSNESYFLKYDGSLWGSGSSVPGHYGFGEGFPLKVADGVASVSAWGSVVLVLRTDGSLWGAGNNSAALGQPSNYSDWGDLVKVAEDVVQAREGNGHTLFVKTDGSLWGVGSNSHGQIGTTPGTNLSRVPLLIAPSDVTAISAGGAHTLFVKSDGTCWALGRNLEGQLGNGSTVNSPVPVQVATGVSRVSGGFYFSLFLKSDRTMWAAGSNNFGQLYDRTTVNRTSPVQVGTGIAACAAGAYHTLVIEGRPAIEVQPAEIVIASGQPARLSVSAVGSGPLSWQWYSGPAGDTSQPVPGATGGAFESEPLTATASYWVRVSNSFGHTDSSGVQVTVVYPPAITAFPADPSIGPLENAVLPFAATGGELTFEWYRGEPGDVSTPAAVIRSSCFVSVPLKESAKHWMRVSNVAGSIDSPAVNVTVLPAVSANLMATGRNQRGQLGNNTTTSRSSPARISGDVIRVAAGGSHTLFLKEDGTLWGSGYNNRGQLGSAATITQRVPVQIASDVSSIAAGDSHSLFVKEDGTLWAMGLNATGQLGDATAINRSVPVPVAVDVVQVAAGKDHSVFLKADGTCWAMGANTEGQLGTGTSTGLSKFIPTFVAGGVARVATGNLHTMLIMADGTLRGAGTNSKGQLGDGSLSRRLQPVQIATDVRAMACGAEHTLFCKTDGALWATGSNGSGELGDGTMIRKFSPVPIASGVLSAEAGAAFSHFVKSTGEVFAMGLNTEGQLGDGTTTSRLLPVSISSGVAVAAGDGHTVLLDARPAIIVQPAHSNVEAGLGVTLGVTATGAAEMTYQWYLGPAGDTSHPVAGATAAVWTTGPLVESVDCWVNVANTFGVAASNTATITVSGGGSASYRAWAAGQGLAVGNLRTTLDPDGDGLANLIEYGFSSDPLSNSASARPVAKVMEGASGKVLGITHKRRKTAGVEFTYFWSETLVTWESFVPAIEVLDDDADDDGEAELIRISRPLAPGEPIGFIRIGMMEP